MSNDNNKSEVTKAATEVNPSDLSENLNNNQNDPLNKAPSKKPEPLNKDEQTPFIDDELRTDK